MSALDDVAVKLAAAFTKEGKVEFEVLSSKYGTLFNRNAQAVMEMEGLDKFSLAEKTGLSFKEIEMVFSEHHYFDLLSSSIIANALGVCLTILMTKDLTQ